MIPDAEIQNWVARHGTVTSFTFIVYGDLKDSEIGLLIKGLTVFLDYKSIISKVAVFCDIIDEEKAVAWNTYQGTRISFIFAGDVIGTESTVESTIMDGLKFLRYKAEYIGHNRSDCIV